MPKLIPENSVRPDSPRSELKVLDAIRENVSDDWVVFHGFEYRRSSKAIREYEKALTAKKGAPAHRFDGEIDFLFFKPGVGFVVLEVKGGRIRCEQGQWYQNDRPAEIIEQARRNKHFIREYILDRLKSTGKLKFAHAYCFPDCDRICGTPSSNLEGIVLLMKDLGNIGTHIGEILTKHGESFGGTATPPDEEIIDLLAPTFSFRTPLGALLKEEEDKLRKLAGLQYSALDAMRNFKRLRIRGGAGAGTPLMAAKKAIELAQGGRRVGLFCFGVTLAGQLRSLVSGCPTVICDAFLEYCISALNITKNEYAKLRNDENFWKSNLPEKWKRYLDRAVPKFDAVIIVEGQDFAEEAWVMINGLVDRGSIFWIFYDPKLNVYNRNLAQIPSFDLPEVVLAKNCVNTKAISRAMESYYGEPVPVYQDAPDGVPVEYREAGSFGECQKILASIIHELNSDRSLDLHRDLVILGAHSFRSVGFRAGMRFGKYEITDGLKPANNSSIPFLTYMKYEGCVSPVVILYNVDRRDARWKVPENMYAAMSCARSRLYVIEVEE